MKFSLSHINITINFSTKNKLRMRTSSVSCDLPIETFVLQDVIGLQRVIGQVSRAARRDRQVQ